MFPTSTKYQLLIASHNWLTCTLNQNKCCPAFCLFCGFFRPQCLSFFRCPVGILVVVLQVVIPHTFDPRRICGGVTKRLNAFRLCAFKQALLDTGDCSHSMGQWEPLQLNYLPAPCVSVAIIAS